MLDYNSTQLDPIAFSKEYILSAGRYPANSLRKPRFKKDFTNLRAKGAQYQDVTRALDLIIDGPSKNDTQVVHDLSLLGGS